MNKKDKERFQKKLLEKKKENNLKVAEFVHESQTVDSQEAQDVADRAESSYTKEFLLSLSDTERKQLLLIDEALKRINECTYGRCQMCGVDIGRKRLEVIPWAPHCLSCQEKSEAESI